MTTGKREQDPNEDEHKGAGSANGIDDRDGESKDSRDNDNVSDNLEAQGYS